MRLAHLGLPVRDRRRSLDFYVTHFAFNPDTAQEYADGTVIVRNADGFDLALHPTQEISPLPAFLHFGFRLPDPAAVREALHRLTAAGVPIEERDDEPGYVAFKCLDPDCHRIEVYWEPPAVR